MANVDEWFKKMQDIGQADEPMIRIDDRILTPRDIFNEVDGLLGDKIREKMGW